MSGILDKEDAKSGFIGLDPMGAGANRVNHILSRPKGRNTTHLSLKMNLFDHFPMQKVEKIRFRMSSEVVWPVRESRDQRAR